jgi:hypothetical protein
MNRNRDLTVLHPGAVWPVAALLRNQKEGTELDPKYKAHIISYTPSRQ